jgi:hypothetical protein
MMYTCIFSMLCSVKLLSPSIGNLTRMAKPNENINNQLFASATCPTYNARAVTRRMQSVVHPYGT